MREKTLLIISADSPSPWPLPVQAMLDGWAGPDRPGLRHVTPTGVLEDAQALEGAQAAWLVLDGPDQPGLFELIGLLQEKLIPAMISRPGETRAVATSYRSGVLVLPLEAPPTAAQAMIRLLWSESDTVRDLQREIRVLRAHQGGLCVQISKMDEELRLAAQLQREFLPAKLPAFKDAAFHVLFRPAGYVSGDIYDVSQLDEDHVGFYIADAVGHGVPAALMTMYIKHSLKTKDIDRSHPRGYRLISPGDVLGRLNQIMVNHQAGKIRTATAWYGLLNLKTRVLSYARAGHPLPLLLKHDGGIIPLESDGGLLGVFPDETFESGSVILEPGDRVLVYTDGFELAFGGGGPTRDKHFDATQYTRELEQLANGRLAHAMQHLAQRLDEQTGSLNQLDDMTALCVEVCPTMEASSAERADMLKDPCVTAVSAITAT